MTTPAPNKPPKLMQQIIKLQNPFMKWLLRSPLHFFVSSMYMLITFTGRKSGQVYTTPVQYRQEGKALYVISSEGYTWWKNLRGGAAVEVRVRGSNSAAYAEVSTDPQMIDALTHKVYPALSAERRQSFLPGKVAITITLQPERVPV